MDYQRLFGACAWSSILVGALLVSACGSSNNGDSGNPGGGQDTGGTTNTDGAAASDTGSNPGADSGPGNRDSGPRTDGGRDAGPPRDGGGRPDSGPMVDPMPNAEGHTCTPDGMTLHGSCTDTSSTSVCFTWTPQMTTPLSTCMRQCNTNMDCATSAVGQVCAGVAFDVTRWQTIKACVSAAINTEGAIATASLIESGANGQPLPMTGCADALNPMYRLSGSLFLDLKYDQVTCGRQCAADTDCMAAAPSCTLNVYTSTLTVATKKGICTTRKSGKGAKCSERKATEMCDVNQSQAMVCLDIRLNDADNMAAQADDDRYGVCLEICDQMMTTCTAKADNVHNGVCKFGFFTSPTLGLCSDGCSAFPNNCVGQGSPPPAGGTAHGAQCFQFRGTAGTVDMPEEAICIDVDQEGTLFTPLTSFQPNMFPPVNCDTNAISCPSRSTCIGLGDPQMHTACVYGCDTTTATVSTSGCMGTDTTTCAKVFGPQAKAGVCQH